jgi:hypothetical protein
MTTPVAPSASGVSASPTHSNRVGVLPKSPVWSGKLQSSHSWPKMLPSSGVPS